MIALAVLVSTTLSGCDGGSGSGHAAKGKADDLEGLVFTLFTEKTELFVEFPPLVRGDESAFAAHLTRLSDFRPVTQGRLVVRLVGGGQPDESFAADSPTTPGIFRPVAKPAHAGTRRLTFELTGPNLSDVHEIGEITVHPTREAAVAAQGDKKDGPEGLVPFFKEQQWKVDFATAAAGVRTLRAAVPAAAVIRGRADGEAHISAPAAGHVLPETAFPRIGQSVAKGQILARLAPRLGGDQDIASLRAEAAKAQADHDLALSERRRLEQLLEQGAIPARRVEEARSKEAVTRAALEAARSRLSSPGAGAASGSGVALRAPIDGTLARVGVGAGQYVDAGSPLFHVVNLDALWLEAAVSEADSLRLTSPDGAWFKLDSRAEPFVISSDNGRLIAVGGAVDPVKRTVPVIFEFENPGRSLRVGAFVTAHVWTGEAETGVAVPETALIDDGGQTIAFVMADGEHFDRRIVRTGIRDAGFVHVASGIAEGERVVTRGAYLVRLAASRPTEAGHGHAH
jgi:RND family efflux transporter MFP subunit